MKTVLKYLVVITAVYLAARSLVDYNFKRQCIKILIAGPDERCPSSLHENLKFLRASGINLV